MKSERLHFVVFGLVQGVFFRASAQTEASGLGLSGWVKNQPNGEVECTAEGKRENLEKFLSWARKGPPGAVVEKIDFSWERATGEFRRFEITG